MNDFHPTINMFILENGEGRMNIDHYVFTYKHQKQQQLLTDNTINVMTTTEKLQSWTSRKTFEIRVGGILYCIAFILYIFLMHIIIIFIYCIVFFCDINRY